jgi:hypothetical protein
MTDWKPISDDAKHGRPVLLWARLKKSPPEANDSYPVVGFWHPAIYQWKVYPEHLNREEDLLASHWVELPAPPSTEGAGQ